jgi:integrase/recombinase XerD
MEIEAFINSFEAYLLTQKRVSRNTLESYMTDIIQLKEFLQKEQLDLKEITQENLTSFLKRIKRRSSLGAKTLSRKISSIKSFYKYINQHYGIIDISAGLIFPKIEKRLPNFLNETEIKQILDISKLDKSNIGLRNNILLSILYVTGIRISEAIFLRISGIRFEENLITVQGKGGKERLIPVPKWFLNNLKNYLSIYHKNLLEDRDTDFLFPVKYGKKIKPMTRQAAWAILKTLVTKSGIQKNVSPHTFRHSLATHLLQKGANLRSLQVWLGHENLSTVEIYTHLNTDHLRKVYDSKHPRK